MPKGTGWKDIPIGGMIVEAGNAVKYETGSWRAFRPVLDAEKCIHCLTCWVYCPDSSILAKDEKMTGFDLMHCKGCGICANVCPVSAIEMKEEGAFADEQSK
ncbi:MAG: 4Fe-4S binding protein [Chloroflexi bacterium]|nr:4Fe-4S binding protein [Chloroflexota bacterium]